MCQFLYACLAFLCIFLWFYICFSVFRVILEGNERNERKLGENKQNWKKLQITEKLKGREQTLQVTNNSFPILAENRLGNW